MEGFQTRRTKLWKKKHLYYVALLGAAAGGAYGIYALWSSDTLKQQRARWKKFCLACDKFESAFISASDVSALLAKDVQTFLRSDAEEVPQSVKQLLKLSQSPVFQHSLCSASFSITAGILRGIDVPTSPRSPSGLSSIISDGVQGRKKQQGDFVSTILDKLFTEEGQGFASAVVGKAVKSLVRALNEGNSQPHHRNGTKISNGRYPQERQVSESAGLAHVVFEMASSEKGKLLLTECCSKVVETFVTVYLDKTSSINMYEDIMLGVSNHLGVAKEVGAHVCCAVAETVVKCCMEQKQSSQAPSAPEGNSGTESLPRRMQSRQAFTTPDILDISWLLLQ